MFSRRESGEPLNCPTYYNFSPSLNRSYKQLLRSSVGELG